MKKNIFDAVPEMPKRFEDKIEATLKALDHANTEGRRIRVGAAVLALILSVMLMGAALAASRSGLLERLFSGITPPEEAEELIVKDADTASMNGVELRLSECLLDGANAHFRWTVTSHIGEPVYYITEIHFPDKAGMSWISTTMDDILLCLDDVKSRDDYFNCVFDAEDMSEISFEVTVNAYRSNYEPMKVGEDFLDLSSDDPVMREMSENRKLGIVHPDYLKFDTYPAYVEAFEEVMKQRRPHVNVYEDRREALVNSGMFEHIAELNVSTTFLPVSVPSARHTKPVQREFELPGGSLVIDALDFSYGVTRIEYRYFPKSQEKLNAMLDHWEGCVYGPDGEEFIDSLLSGMLVYDDNGLGHFVVRRYVRPVDVVPEYVTLKLQCPTADGDLIWGDMEREDITIRIE